MSNYCFVSWFLLDKCNFNCAYCHGSKMSGLKGFLKEMKRKIRQRLTPFDPNLVYKNIDIILSRFRSTKRSYTFGFTGGEPFLLPRFVEICKKIISTDNYKIAIDTNLSINIEKFINLIPPDKVEYINASVHIHERERLSGLKDKFVTYGRTLLELDYNIKFNYVLWPDLFPILERRS